MSSFSPAPKLDASNLSLNIPNMLAIKEKKLTVKAALVRERLDSPNQLIVEFNNFI